MRLSKRAQTGYSAMTVDEVIALEQRIAAQGTSLRTLMERAGAALAERVTDELPDGGRVLILCGSGNNGGDGWVAARLLAQAGYAVSLLATRKPGEITAEPARSAAAEFADQARYGWNDPQVIADCLLGTGFNGAEVSGAGAEWIRKANASEAFRLACDVPSGLSARTGKVAEPCFKAHATVTMLAVKTGMTSEDAASVVGELRVAPLIGE